MCTTTSVHGVKSETKTVDESTLYTKNTDTRRRQVLSLSLLLLYLDASFGGRGPTTLGLGLLFPAAAVVDRRRRRRRFPGHRGRDRFGPDRYTGRPGGSGALRTYRRQRRQRRRLAARGHVLGQHHGGGGRRPGRLIGGRGDGCGAAPPGRRRRALEDLADHFGRTRGPLRLSAQCARRHGQHRCAGPGRTGQEK